MAAGWARRGWRRAALSGWLCLLPACALAVGTPRIGALTLGEHWTRVNGHRMFYSVHGSGPVLLLLHGGGSSGGQSFARQFSVFERQHLIIAPDQVGQGRTPDVPGPLSYTAMLSDTLALLHHLHVRRADIMGFSDGGILALMLAAREPRLVHRMVISGVNVAPEGLNPQDLQEMRAVPAAKAATRGQSAASLDDKLRELWLHSPAPAELSLKQLAAIVQPVLVVSGDHDAVTLEHTLAIYQALPNAELYVLPGTSHDTFGGRPDWVNPIAADFLDRAD